MSETTASAPAASTVTPADSVTPSSARHRRARTALRVVQVLLALFYGIASACQAHRAPVGVRGVRQARLGQRGMYTIGVLELAGAIALLIPVLQSVAATALGALMVGAFIVQVTAFEGENAATPLILLVPLALIAWARRAANNELWGLVRRGEWRGRRGGAPPSLRLLPRQPAQHLHRPAHPRDAEGRAAYGGGGGRFAGVRRDGLTPTPTPVSFRRRRYRRLRSGQTIRAAARGRDDTGWAFSLATLTLHR